MKTKTVKDAIKTLISTTDASNIVSSYAYSKYTERMGIKGVYQGYNIIDENNIRISYMYYSFRGLRHDDSFIVEI